MTELWPTSLGEGAEWRNQDLADIRAFHRGVSDLWTNVNHIAIVVSNVGTSLSFYTDVIGMKQILRPDFDRYLFSFIQIFRKMTNCELRKKIRTRTRACTLARVQRACEKVFKTCVRCAAAPAVFS